MSTGRGAVNGLTDLIGKMKRIDRVAGGKRQGIHDKGGGPCGLGGTCDEKRRQVTRKTQSVFLGNAQRSGGDGVFDEKTIGGGCEGVKDALDYRMLKGRLALPN